MLPELLNKEPVVSLRGKTRWSRDARGSTQQSKGWTAYTVVKFVCPFAQYGKQLYMNYQEALKRTESAYDWTSLSSSSIKSGSSSSSLPGSNVICLVIQRFNYLFCHPLSGELRRDYCRKQTGFPKSFLAIFSLKHRLYV